MNSNLNIGSCLSELGVNQNDVVMIHGDAGVAAQFKDIPHSQKLETLIEQFKIYFGNEGTIVVPAFSYSFCKGENFDLKETPSEVGMFSEFFRKSGNISRSNHPIFSVSTYGKLASIFSNSNNSDCFGINTAFDLLFKYDGTIICLGCELDRVTFVHYVEQKFGVPYRYFKTFTGLLKIEENFVGQDVTFFVRDESIDASCDLDKFKISAEKANKLRKSNFGRFPVYAIKARDFLSISIDMLKTDIYSLIKEGRK